MRSNIMVNLIYLGTLVFIKKFKIKFYAWKVSAMTLRLRIINQKFKILSDCENFFKLSYSAKNMVKV